MLKLIKTLFKGKILFIAIGVTIGILYLSLLKVPKTSINIDNADKLYHCFAYFVLTFTWLLYFRKKPNKKYLVVISCIFFGIIIEILQSTLTNYRTADYLDALANSLGVLIALMIFNLICKKNYIN